MLATDLPNEGSKSSANVGTLTKHNSERWITSMTPARDPTQFFFQLPRTSAREVLAEYLGRGIWANLG